MGSVASGGGASGVGVQGPPGLQGPPGPAGGLDPATSALGVFARATLPGPIPMPVGQWTVLDFSLVESDARQAIQPGPLWRFLPPTSGAYLFQVNLTFQPVGPQITTVSVRFMRNNQVEETQQSFLLTSANLTPSVQMTYLARISPGEIMHVELRADGPAPLQMRPGPPRSAIVIQGVGVVP